MRIADLFSEGRRKSREPSPAVPNRLRDEEIPLGSMKGHASRKTVSSTDTTPHDLNGPSSTATSVSASPSNQSTSSQASRLVLNLNSEDTQLSTSTSEASCSGSNTKEVVQNKDDVTTPHLETSFISDVPGDNNVGGFSTDDSGQGGEGSETNSDAQLLPQTPQHSNTSNGSNNGPTNSIFVPKVKKKGAIETV